MFEDSGPVHAGPDFEPITKGRLHGTTEVIIGPMYASKTETGFQRVRSAIIGGKKAVVIKHATDTRYSRKALASSHDGSQMKAIVVDSLTEDPPNLPLDIELIFVDEGQFMDGLANFCMRQNTLGRDVVVAALNSYGNKDRTGWPNVMELLPRATKITSLNSTCALCHGVAECSRLLQGTNSKGSVIVGGDSDYIATCSGCYTREISPGMIEKHRQNVKYVKWLSSQSE